jgi:NAD(P)-dependent dehydrogenase (short-subunit alcohol dehydrogenase family)
MSSAIIGFVRSFGEHLPKERITLNTICPNIVKTSISESSFYEKANEKGLLTEVDTLLDAFESLLGDSDISGAAVEVLPGNDGYRIKEHPEYTNEKCRESVDMARDPSHRSNKFHQPVVD